MDKETDLPSLFRQFGVFVLPLDRRSYAIIRGQGYHQTEEISSDAEVFEATLPITLIEMAERGPENEGRYMQYAYNSGLLEHFLSIRGLRGYFSGRTTTPEFSFCVGKVPVEVNKAQIEIDQAYIDGGQLILAEAKIGVPRSFIIRQLYYPFRTFKAQEPNRRVRTILFAYDQNAKTYNLWEYMFTEPRRYDSIELVKAERFQFRIKQPEPGQFETDPDLTDSIPQANDVGKIMELPVQVGLGKNDRRAIAAHFHFDERQSSYYRQAAEMLGLVELKSGRYSLTGAGARFVELSVPSRNRAMTEQLFKHPIMQEVLKNLISRPEMPVTQSQIVTMISRRSSLTGTTPPRRANTILSWFRWIQVNFGLIVVEKKRIWLATHFPDMKLFSS